jgi:hypothetical protein
VHQCIHFLNDPTSFSSPINKHPNIHAPPTCSHLSSALRRGESHTFKFWMYSQPPVFTVSEPVDSANIRLKIFQKLCPY